VNFGTPVPLLLGIFLVLSAVALFFLDRLKPGYGRDVDRIYSILFLISGVILLGNLNMDLILSFQQMLMVGMLIALTIQNINARTAQNVRGSRGPDTDPYMGGGGYRPSRPSPSRPSYADSRTNLRAELDMRGGPPDDRYSRPRPMLGGRDEPPRNPYPQDEYPDRYGREIPPGGGESRPEAGPPYYGGSGGSRPGDDRVRRRRPSKPRGDVYDPYRLDPGPPPPRPDYRPNRE
jgi:hypothetical protein